MAEDTEQDQKTEEATAKRISEAREQGNLPISREMATWFFFLGVLTALAWLLPMLASDIKDALRPFVEKPEQISLQDGGFQNALMGFFAGVAPATAATFGLILVMAILGTMIQTDFYVGTGKLKLDFNKLTFSHGYKQLFSMNAISELVKSFFKLVVLGYIAFRVLRPIFDTLPSVTDLGLMAGLAFLHDKAVHLLVVLMLVITVIAVADILYVRYQYFKGLRMSKQEVKDEHKQMEGDPFVKSRLRQIRLEKARRRMMAKVPNASVVVTNPTHFAVALEYDGQKMLAPVVTAKGADHIAARIRQIAEEHEIPLVSNPPLARALYDTADLDAPIEPEHYRAVAEVISYVYKLKKGK